MANHIVLYQPEIPSNTGNIARTCAGTNATLHLIRPLGFSMDDKVVRRAGLDYWPYVSINYYDSLDELFNTYPEGLFYFLTKHGKQAYSEVDYSDTSVDYFFVFGRESSGLPEELLTAHRDKGIRLPMSSENRTLNLSNIAAIMIYEVLRQQDYPGLYFTDPSHLESK